MKKYRLILWFFLCLDIAGIACFCAMDYNRRMPEKIWLMEGKTGEYDFALPFTLRIDSDEIQASASHNPPLPADQVEISLQEPFSLSSDETGEYEATLSLFGVFPIRKVTIGVMEQTELIAGGEPVGIYLHTDGILVLGCGRFALPEGGTDCPAENILRTGDYILEVNGVNVYEKEDIIREVQRAKSNPVQLTIRRRDVKTVVTVRPKCSADGTYRLGVWIRDDTAGIGTVTYINPATGEYGALGHGVADGDTGKLLLASSGTLYPAEILSVIRGEAGAPGELVGTLNRSVMQQMGDIRKNTGFGIFGTLSDFKMTDADRCYEIALRQEVKKGNATVLCGFEGKILEYSIEIERVNLGADDNKGITIRVTDPELIAKTGGIVQGMSGSPIIQDGKLVGAVTHVLIRDPLRGYGTFIEDMLAASK